MAENKFIAQLKGNTAPGSVLEIQDKGSKTSFANMPSGTSDAIVTYSDKRNNATAVLKGAMNWKVNGSTLSIANPAGDGSDYTGQTDVSGISDQQGNNLWINASYTVPAGGLFLTKNTKWVLKLCGDNLIVNGGDTAEFTVLITAGNSTNITKKFFVGEQANQFCKELVIDFAESNISGVKLEQGDSISLKLLCDIPNASARIYQGMTTLTLLQRAVDAENVISNAGSFEEVVDDIDYLENHIIVKSATMPTASADLLGEVYQYTGATAYPYEHGYIYECMQTSPGVYAWERIDVQPGGSRGRFLSLWNCATGLAVTNPPISPYEYKAGDYFIVSNVSSGTNYKPSGTEYVIGTPSTAVETEDVFVDDTYFFDGTSWKLQNTSNDIKDLVDTKVSKDGSSIMSGPLKFRAGSFEGAIAGGLGDGISVYKMNADGSINSEVAALTKTNGFIPGTTNSMNIGSSSLKWKDAYIERVITSVLNNGANINVPTTAGTLALTSDIAIKSTDANIVNPTAGQWLQYNGTKWENISLTPANINLSNLTDDGANITNWSANVSNCLVYVPQNIKLTLSSSTFTLASGSVLYKADGTASTTTTNQTLTPSLGSFTGKMLIFATTAGVMQNPVVVSKITSGTTEPANPNNLDVFFNTSTKVIRLYNNGNWIDWPVCCPIAEISVSSGTITSFQVFNGFGYMGSTLFMLPGTSGLRPNGRKADGSLNNIKLTVNNIRFSTFSQTYNNASIIVATTGNTAGNYTYDEVNNHVVAQNGNIQLDRFMAGWVSATSGRITSLRLKTVFHAVDYNNDGDLQIKGEIITLGANSLRFVGSNKYGTIFRAANDKFYMLLTNQNDQNGNYNAIRPFSLDCATGEISTVTPTAGDNSTKVATTAWVQGHGILTDSQMPTADNNYTWYRKYSDGWVEQGGMTSTGSHTANITLPVAMSDTNYVAQVTNGTSGTGWVQITAKSTTGFSVQAFSSDFNSRNVGGSWYVSGIAA